MTSFNFTTSARSPAAPRKTSCSGLYELAVGGTVTLAKTKFTIVGIVSQSAASNPPDVYIPLAVAQVVGLGPYGSSLHGQVNTIYVAAASSADIPAVQQAISVLLPSATVSTSSSLASAVTGSLSALIWWSAARSAGARPAALRYSAVGIVLVPVTLAAALAAGHLP